MPEVSFIWKYEDPNSTIADSLPNVRLSAWVPQIPLLRDGRLSAFLTHGGIGSTNEVAYIGKPTIVVGDEQIRITHSSQVPIFGDQMRNANMLAQHGGALVLDKTDLGDAKKLRNAFGEVIENDRFVGKLDKITTYLILLSE
ncbi:hypothetical protein OESDEN_02588 [Oesophagostomum dentatum]|uniref:glucuronosyltransferase n=1 Tax=Oesophagostomum dentatum TaxID=61180 RepID=A0A0B1TJJ3_OESDE|nr:hypothetical protein OESDEN_02588 [Oesophagostomum dentatum]